MDDFKCSNLNNKRYIKTYPTPKEKSYFKRILQENGDIDPEKTEKREPLTTRNAVKLLLQGTLKTDVCRYCLHVTSYLSELDQILEVGKSGILFKVTIRDMIATFHPFKIADDPNYPNKICSKCLDTTIRSYLFAQQCEQAERSLRNCFEDIYEKLDKLDPIEAPRKRGRRKLNPNHNVLYVENDKVMDYAQPIINLVHVNSAPLVQLENEISELECLKCCEILPNIESLLNHENIHPKTMWYNCRLCGRSFAKRYQIKKHLQSHQSKQLYPSTTDRFVCKKCNYTNENCNEFLQHIEKHKFKTVMEHLLEKRMDRLCSVCLDKRCKMVELDKMIHVNAPNLSGDHSLHSILASTLPDMNNLNNYTGTKVCEKCLNNAITSYIFTNQFVFNRARLNTCVSLMLDSLKEITEPECNLFIEISGNTIMPLTENVDDEYVVDKDDVFDESKFKTEVLEDEFRVQTDSDKESSDVEEKLPLDVKQFTTNHLVNGIQPPNSLSVCSEFLTFKTRKKPRKVAKPKYTCPLCSKHFVSDFHLKQHLLKHINRKVTCKICLCEFKSKFHLYEHTKMVHLLNKINYESCRHCDRAFVDLNKFKNHLKTHFKKMCELCCKVFRSQRFYNSHIQRHAVHLRRYKERHEQNCSFCEKGCVDSNELYLHINKAHLQIKPYDCEMCEQKFYTEKNLRSHRKVHSLFQKETCVFCCKNLNSRRQLVYHVWKHLGVTPFSCPVCGQAFRTKRKVRLHMTSSHGGNSCCKFCRKVFLSKIGLKEHIVKAHSYI